VRTTLCKTSPGGTAESYPAHGPWVGEVPIQASGIEEPTMQGSRTEGIYRCSVITNKMLGSITNSLNA
jgi:hypothetical protein